MLIYNILMARASWGEIFPSVRSMIFEVMSSTSPSQSFISGGRLAFPNVELCGAKLPCTHNSELSSGQKSANSWQLGLQPTQVSRHPGRKLQVYPEITFTWKHL